MGSVLKGFCSLKEMYMAYETKVILKSLANQVVLARDLEQAYELIKDVAQTEEMTLPPYEDAKKSFRMTEKKTNP